mgnify:CR=1 FL=1
MHIQLQTWLVCSPQAAKLDGSLSYLTHDFFGVRFMLDEVLGSLSAGVIECTYNFKNGLYA